MPTKIFKIQNMYCTACESKISKILSLFPQIAMYRTNIFTKELFIEYSNIKISFIKRKLENNGFVFEKQRNSRSNICLIICSFYFLQYFYPSLFLSICINVIYYKTNRVDTTYIAALISLTAGSSIYIGNTFLQLAYAIFDVPHLSLGSPDIFIDNSSVLLLFKAVGSAIIEKIENSSILYLHKINASKNKGAIYAINNIYALTGNILFDGVVVSGEVFVDESNISGESTPIHKTVGSYVFCGTNIIQGEIEAKVLVIGKQTKLGKIIQQIKRIEIPRNMKLEVFEKYIIYLCICVFIFWFILGMLNIRPEILYSDAVYSGSKIYLIFEYIFSAFRVSLLLGLNCLVISCPCVFSIAEPLLYLKISKQLFNKQILVKNLNFIKKEFARVFVDKTGTLTEDCIFEISGKVYEDDILKMIYMLESGTVHPVGVAIREYCYRQINNSINQIDESMSQDVCQTNKSINQNVCHNIKSVCHTIKSVCQTDKSINQINNSINQNVCHTIKSACQTDKSINQKYKDVKYIHGKGIEGVTENGIMRIGSLEFTMNSKEILNSKLEAPNMLQRATVYVSLNYKHVAEFTVSQILRKDALRMIEYFYCMGVQPIILTGDSYENTVEIARSLGIPSIYHSMSSIEKLKMIDSNSIFIGDGMNDSPGLVRAGLGISIEMNNDAANIVLLNKRLGDVIYLMELKRRAKRRLLVNYILSGVYNAIALPVVCGMFVPFGFVLDLKVSCICMTLSSLSVVVSSMLFN